MVAYLGGFGSDLHAAAASVAEKNKIAYLGIAFALNKIHQQGFRYLFSPFWKSPDIGKHTQGLLALIPAGERPEDRGDLPGEDRLGPEMAAAWVEAGKAAGYQVVVQGEYAPGAKDFSDLILKAKAANADAVFAHSDAARRHDDDQADEGARLQPQDERHDPRAPTPPPGRRTSARTATSSCWRAGWHNAMKAPGVKELNDAHEKKFGRPSDPIVGPAYACVQILAAAITRAGSADREKIRDAIAAADMVTVIGPVKFRPDGTGIVQSAFAQWQNGKQELVWPKEYATAPLLYPAPPFAKR